MILRDYNKLPMKIDRWVINAEEAIIAIIQFYSLPASYPSSSPCSLISLLLKTQIFLIYIVGSNTDVYFLENDRLRFELQNFLSLAMKNCQFSLSILQTSGAYLGPCQTTTISVLQKWLIIFAKCSISALPVPIPDEEKKLT